MSATIAQVKHKHFPVLLNDVIRTISPQDGGTFIDCTFGQGGYSKKILEFPKTKIIAIDRDINSLFYAEKLKKKFKSRFKFYNKKFSQLDEININDEIKGIIFDLGFSNSQIKDISKGLSFKHTGKLNMKMGMNDFSADDVIRKLDQKGLDKIFKYFGEEKKSGLISKKIVQERRNRSINTEDLVRIINFSKKNYSKIDKSTKVFQAIRIFVNNEISELITGLSKAANIISDKGIILTVSFHSLEDKICKYFFSSLSNHQSVSRYLPVEKEKKLSFHLITKKPIIPNPDEIKKNISSRSAKLRAVIKMDSRKVETNFIYKKFKNLLEIEQLNLNL